MKEFRLTGYNASDFGDPKKYNRRTAEANAAQQQAQHLAQLALNQSTKQIVGAGMQTAGKVSTNQSLSNAQNVYANQQAGLQSSMGQSIQNGQIVQGKVQTAGNGVLQQSAIDRLRASGMSDEQIREQIARMQPEIQQTMSNTGLGGTARKSAVNASIEQQAEQAALEAEARLGSQASLEDRERVKRETKANFLAQEQIKQGQQRQEQAREGNNAAATEAAARPVKTPAQEGASALFANLPENAKAFAPFFQNILDSIEQGQQDQAKATNALLNGGTVDVNGQPVMVNGINKAYDEMDTRLKDMEAGYTKMQEGIQGMLDKAKEAQEKAIDQQERAAQERLNWQENESLRRADREKAKAVDSKVAELALKNRMGGDGGLREVDEVKAKFEESMNDIRFQFGTARTDLSAKFTGLHAEATNNYVTQTIGNMKDSQAASERLEGQRMASSQAKTNAQKDILTNFFTQQANARKEYAGSLKSAVTEMRTIINQDRDDARSQEQLGWQRLEWIAKTYGSSAPQALLDSVGKQLPGVDVRSVMNQLTLAEMKKRSGSAGVVSGFSAYLMKSAGQPPSFEDFIADKERKLGMSLTPSARERYRDEYKAQLSVTKQHNPTEILNRFAMKAGTLTNPNRKFAEKQLADYLQSGQYELAADFVDNTGDDIPSTESRDFTQALNARYDINKLSGLVEEIGQIGPITGRVRALNPYDDRAVRFKNLITQTVPNLARGVFREVGVLTDTDVARYTSTIGNPNLTLQQAQQAFKDLKDKIDVSMHNQINVWDANGKRVKGFRDLYNSQPMNQDSGATQADEDFARSILGQ